MKEPKVSVGILTADQISFELNGNFYLSDQVELIYGVLNASIKDGKILIESQGKIETYNQEITFIPQNYVLDSFILNEVVIGVKFHWEQKENQRFLGNLKLLIEDDKITAINIVPVEEYLTSVISSEMSAKSSIELLKAHSMISRGWLLAQIEKREKLQKEKTVYKTVEKSDDEYIKWYDREDHRNYDVCADDHCQRYQGVTKAYTEKVKAAVEETRGLVLISDGKICDARFSKSCGGVSESFENVWEPISHPYLSSIYDYKVPPENCNIDFTNEKNAGQWIMSYPNSYCNTDDVKILSQVLLDIEQKITDFYRWKLEYTQSELSSIIKEKSGIDFGDILDLIPVQRGKSSRLIKLKIVGSKKTLTIGKELEIRRTLSKTHLYSSAFIVKKENIIDSIPQKFILHGAGWGHGVGLCQIGAAVMGEMGFKFDEILLHYFKGTRIKKLY